jgi:hypothetical protein
MAKAKSSQPRDTFLRRACILFTITNTFIAAACLLSELGLGVFEVLRLALPEASCPAFGLILYCVGHQVYKLPALVLYAKALCLPECQEQNESKNDGKANNKRSLWVFLDFIPMLPYSVHHAAGMSKDSIYTLLLEGSVENVGWHPSAFL